MPDATTRTAVRHAHVGIIGAGFSGIGLAVRLQQAGIDDFVILESGDSFGGTWRANTYPGCACDVPSNLYSYSFAPNPDWTSTFAHQDEIKAYAIATAERFDLPRRTQFGVTLLGAAWNDERQLWDVRTSDGDWTFDVFVSATGPLNEPKLPDVPGIDSFPGPAFHSAQWDHSVDLTGKRVAVVGTGASAVQLVPEVQKVAAKLSVFQRTPAWVLPRGERPTSKLRRGLFRRFPKLQLAFRNALYYGYEVRVIGLVRQWRIMRAAVPLAKAHMYRQVKDPELRKQLTPNWLIGCKRILLTNDFYPALTKPNAELLSGGVAEIRGNTIVNADGQEREVDVLIFSTGFHVTDAPIAPLLTGRDGHTLAERWTRTGAQSYRAGTVPGFPNAFVMLGPNTGLGHSSMIFMGEAQSQYIVDAVKTLQKINVASFEPNAEQTDRWNAGIQKRMRTSIWTNGGCASWYLDEEGRNTTLWPDFTITFKRILRRFDVEHYETTPHREPVAASEPVEAS
jgi:cation diffusion facilitator CzcD-associated flavoprotein CzcO